MSAKSILPNGSVKEQCEDSDTIKFDIINMKNTLWEWLWTPNS